MKRRPRAPIALPVAIVLFFVLGVIAGPIIRSFATPEQMAKNVLLNAIPFILIFIAILLTYVTIIVLVGSVLNNYISKRFFRIIETVLLIGIVTGILAMFQPWALIIYRYGFLLLLFSTLGYILWSHLTPKKESLQEDISSAPISK